MAAPAHKGCPSLWYRQGRMQRCPARALAGLSWPLGRTRAHAVSSLASRASRFCPSSPHGLLAPGRAASEARLCSSEQRASTSPLKARPPPPLRNIERRGSETWAARRARRPKHGAITCSYDNQDDLKLLCGRASRRDWAFCPVAFASGLSETSHGWSVPWRASRAGSRPCRFCLAPSPA